MCGSPPALRKQSCFQSVAWLSEMVGLLAAVAVWYSTSCCWCWYWWWWWWWYCWRWWHCCWWAGGPRARADYYSWVLLLLSYSSYFILSLVREQYISGKWAINLHTSSRRVRVETALPQVFATKNPDTTASFGEGITRKWCGHWHFRKLRLFGTNWDYLELFQDFTMVNHHHLENMENIFGIFSKHRWQANPRHINHSIKQANPRHKQHFPKPIWR